MRRLCSGYAKKDLGLAGAKDTTPTVRGCISTSHVNCMRMVMPGIAIVYVIGEHAITLDEFKTIYAIYKKYEGKELFTFHKERFDCY